MITFTDTDLERMIRRAWYHAVRATQDVRQQCATHGSNGHSQLCLDLGAAARSADRYWHHLMTERSRRKDTPTP